jgi:hypothetical protein
MQIYSFQMMICNLIIYFLIYSFRDEVDEVEEPEAKDDPLYHIDLKVFVIFTYLIQTTEIY